MWAGFKPSQGFSSFSSAAPSWSVHACPWPWAYWAHPICWTWIFKDISFPTADPWSAGLACYGLMCGFTHLPSHSFLCPSNLPVPSPVGHVSPPVIHVSLALSSSDPCALTTCWFMYYSHISYIFLDLLYTCICTLSVYIMYICMYMHNFYTHDTTNDQNPAENTAQAWREHMQK